MPVYAVTDKIGVRKGVRAKDNRTAVLNLINTAVYKNIDIFAGGLKMELTLYNYVTISDKFKKIIQS